MKELDIHLDIFEGPIDLLIHLIRKNNLDIYDIPISQITSEYLEYLDIMKSLNLEIAGEFLVMASTLMQIKAKVLLPSQVDSETGEKGPDPRGKLVNMIEEYQRYKGASKSLEERFSSYKDVFYRGSPVFTNEEKFLDLEIFAFVEAVKRAFARLPDAVAVEGESFPLEPRIDKILDLLSKKEWVLLDEVFSTETARQGVITCFIALLELVKQRRIMARQDDACGEVRIYLRPEPAAAPEKPAPAAPEQSAPAAPEQTAPESPAQE